MYETKLKIGINSYTVDKKKVGKIEKTNYGDIILTKEAKNEIVFKIIHKDVNLSDNEKEKSKKAIDLNIDFLYNNYGFDDVDLADVKQKIDQV